MKKPEFPKPRLIREDFLPEQDPMKNYRIKKVIDGHLTSYSRYYPQTRYYPQKKWFGLFWINVFGFLSDWDGGYYSFENAQNELHYHLRKSLRKPAVIEYLEVDCGENK